jgi:hypothetical protein
MISNVQMTKDMTLTGESEDPFCQIDFQSLKITKMPFPREDSG